jgi:hypothetical protein
VPLIKGKFRSVFISSLCLLNNQTQKFIRFKIKKPKTKKMTKFRLIFGITIVLCFVILSLASHHHHNCHHPRRHHDHHGHSHQTLSKRDYHHSRRDESDHHHQNHHSLPLQHGQNDEFRSNHHSMAVQKMDANGWTKLFDEVLTKLRATPEKLPACLAKVFEKFGSEVCSDAQTVLTIY